MKQSENLRYHKLLLRGGAGTMPALGFGTLIADATETRNATRTALEAGFRHFDCAERYRNEEQVGEAIREVIQAGSLTRRDLFITTKLWNNNHRPERVQPAFELSRNRLQLEYIDLYLIHTPYAFQPGDNQDPRDKNGHVIYDDSITLKDTWRAMEALVDGGKCKAIGLSDISLDQLREIFESARIKPAVVQVESHPYLPQTELLEFCNSNGLVMLAFAPLGHGIKPGVLENPVIISIAQQVNKTPAQVLLAWAIQRGAAVLTTPKTPDRARENFDLSALPVDAMEEINAIQTRQRLNLVTGTGIPGFIATRQETGAKQNRTGQREESMGEEEIRAALERHWSASAAGDQDAEHEIYADDAICDYPQSGERIIGRQNLQALRSQHPDKPSGFRVIRIQGSSNLWITQYTITYQSRRLVYTVSIMEFGNGKVVHETQYFADPFEAPAWRAKWVEQMGFPSQ